MKVSLNTIKRFTKIDLSPTELVTKINEQLGGVEAVTELAPRYKGAVVAKVVSCEKHSGADRLKVCLIDDGGIVKNVTRDKDGFVQVVCGALNVRKDMYVVWLPPGATVPSSFDETEPFVLATRELRGVVSNGMLASPKELGLGESHEGILEINKDEWSPTGAKIVPGASFAALFGLDDTIIEIENKMFTHRPDCFGQIGVAREIAGIQHRAFTSPDWYKVLPGFNSGDGLDLTVKNDASSVVPRFMAVAIDGIEVKASPVWLQAELIRLGGKPINNIVDVTNYIMLLTGQPIHAYDYDLLEGAHLDVRLAKKGEKAGLLNGKVYQLDNSDIVIVDGEKIVGLGGVMGGGNSEVSVRTTRIVLECATFDMYAVRKTSMRHGLFTEAVTRFNKGQSPLQNEYVLALAVQSIQDVAGGTIASQVFDAHGSKSLAAHKPVDVTVAFVNDRLGLTLTAKEIVKLLSNVEFQVDETKSGKVVMLKVTVPFWRTDIELPEDIVEEVGRLYGFDKLPRKLPMRPITPAAKNHRNELRNTVRNALSRAGANEVLTYSFVHENVMKNSGQDSAHAYKLSNALSPDLQYYRTSLVPSLLDKIHINFRAGYDKFAIFEIGKVHYKSEMDKNDSNVPNEDEHVAFVLTGGKKSSDGGAVYYQARKYLEQILDLSAVDLQPLAHFDLTSDVKGAQLCAAYDPQRSAVLVNDGQIWGVVGEFTPLVQRSFKLPELTAGFEVHLDLLVSATTQYRPLSRFPSVWQDISLKAPSTLKYAELYDAITHSLHKIRSADLQIDVTPQAIYRGKADSSHTSTTFRFTVTSQSHTLTDKDVVGLLAGVVADLGVLGAIQN